MTDFNIARVYRSPGCPAYFPSIQVYERAKIILDLDEKIHVGTAQKVESPAFAPFAIFVLRIKPKNAYD